MLKCNEFKIFVCESNSLNSYKSIVICATMTFDINQSFKLCAFVWGDYDGERFQQTKRTWLIPYIWSRFWWIFAAYDLLRYLLLAVLPSSYHDVLEFYLGESPFRQFKRLIFPILNFPILISSDFDSSRRLCGWNFGKTLPFVHFGWTTLQWLVELN